MGEKQNPDGDQHREASNKRGLSRRQFLGAGAAAGSLAAMGPTMAWAQSAGRGASPAGSDDVEYVFVNGRIHTMDSANTVVDSVAIKDGRFSSVGAGGAPGPGTKVINLHGRTVVPGLIDAHNHIVLVGNRPGHHVLLEDVPTLDGVLERYAAVGADIPSGEWITTVGPVAASQFPEQRLPNLSELDEIDHPVYMHAADEGIQTNSLGIAIFRANGIEVSDDGVVGGRGFTAPALKYLREQLLTPESRRRTAAGALEYYTSLGITTHLDDGAFHSDEPSEGLASENTYTMHDPFLELNRAGKLPARLRINFLHLDGKSLVERLKNSFEFFGNDMMRTGGIGEFTGDFRGGSVDDLRAIAEAGWRAEDHALSLSSARSLIERREAVNEIVPIDGLRWVISHVPDLTQDLIDRWDALGGGFLVGWGPTRTGTNVGPAYRTILDDGVRVGYHSDGGDITVINPWLNFYTMITGKNLAGDQILGQTVTRQEAMWLATAANKWFIGEDDLGSIEVGNHADLTVLDRDFFNVPEDEIRNVRSLLTVIGGNVAYDAGVM